MGNIETGRLLDPRYLDLEGGGLEDAAVETNPLDRFGPLSGTAVRIVSCQPSIVTVVVPTLAAGDALADCLRSLEISNIRRI